MIVGCGRSGTQFMATYLSSLGLDIKHERPGGDGCVSWPMVVNSYSPWGPIENNPQFKHIIHQVRNPLHVITSWYINLSDLARDEWNFVRNHIPEIDRKNDSALVHCAKYWYYWNLKAEAISEWRFRIEDLEKTLPKLEKHLGIKLNKKKLQQTPHTINSWKPTHQKISWQNLKKGLPSNLFKKIQNMAKRYGYPITD